MKETLICVVAAFANLTAGNTLVAGNWTQFRGNDGSGTSSEAELPLNWGDGENLVWKTGLPGYGASSPITYGDRIFLTGYSGYGTASSAATTQTMLKLHVTCLNRSDGTVRWDRKIDGNDNEQDYKRFVALHGYASGTPATDGKAVFAFFGSSGVVAYDYEGELLWTADVGDKTHIFGSGTSPVLFGDLVIVNASVESGSLVALDKQTGDEVWRAPDINSAWNTPLLVDVGADKPEMVVNTNTKLLAFDPSSGEPLWNFTNGAGTYICPSVVAENDIVYAVGGRSGKVVAVRGGGRGDVTESHQVWASEGQSNVPSPVLHDGRLHWVSDKGIAFCLDAQSGEQVYKKRIADAKKVYASVVAVDDRLYVLTCADGAMVLSAGSEFEQLAHNVFSDDDSIFNASPVVSNGQLLIRSDRFLYCVD